MRRVVVGLGVAVAALALGGLSSTPALAADSGADLSKTLHVSMKFTQAMYYAGDPAHLTVTLTNSDSSPLPGVQAGCTSVGLRNELTGTGPGWAPLVDGVDLAAEESKTIDVWETVPAAAADYGAVDAYCFFGPNAHVGANFPTARAHAKVFGAATDYRLRLLDGPKPIANTKVYALDPDTKQIGGRAVTDETGLLEFKGIHVGAYEMYIVGPWQSVDGRPIIFDVTRLQPPGKINLALKSGPYQPDLEPGGGTSVPTTSASRPPVTSAPVTSTTAGVGAGGTSNPSSTSAVIATTTAMSAAALPKRLPNTGADVFGPTVAGLALLAAGAGALLVARRRKATS
jgi:LPXTG-motif cell wall-anchored protein